MATRTKKSETEFQKRTHEEMLTGEFELNPPFLTTSQANAAATGEDAPDDYHVLEEAGLVQTVNPVLLPRVQAETHQPKALPTADKK